MPRVPHALRAPRASRRLRRSLAGVLGAALVATAAAACSGGADAEGPAGTLNVGQLGAAEVTRALLEAAGEANTDYKVTYSLYPNGGPGFLEAVPSGAVDMAFMADTPSIFAQAAGLPVKAISVATTLKEGESTVEIFAAADSKVRDLADLKGRKVATTEGTILQYTLAKALEEEGLSLKDVQVVNLSPPDAIAAFDSGDVDAVTALDPQLSQLAAKGAMTIGDGVGLTSGYFFGVATEDAIGDEQKADNLRDFVERHERARKWADEHPDEWAEKYAEVTGLPLEIAKAIVAREQYTPVIIDDEVYSHQQAQADKYAELGLLQNKLDVKAEFAPDFLEDAS